VFDEDHRHKSNVRCVLLGVGEVEEVEVAKNRQQISSVNITNFSRMFATADFGWTVC